MPHELPVKFMRRLPTLCLLYIIIFMSLISAARDASPTAACSIHLWWQSPEATCFYNEATVQKSTAGSYFMVCGWNTGYFGIQELGDGNKVVLFSVWDPARGNNPDNVPLEQRVEVLHQGKGVEVTRFGGEGTGGKSIMPFDWKTGKKVRCLVQATVEGGKTAYAGWLWMPTKQEWKHLVTFRVTTGGKPLSGLYSFVEDFRRDGRSVKEERRCEYGNGWVKTLAGKMEPLAHGSFTKANSPEEAQDLINAGQVNGCLFLATGGKVTKKLEVGTLLDVKPVPVIPPVDLPK
jgi:hypothetical protein